MRVNALVCTFENGPDCGPVGHTETDKPSGTASGPAVRHKWTRMHISMNDIGLLLSPQEELGTVLVRGNLPSIPQDGPSTFQMTLFTKNDLIVIISAIPDESQHI